MKNLQSYQCFCFIIYSRFHKKFKTINALCIYSAFHELSCSCISYGLSLLFGTRNVSVLLVCRLVLVFHFAKISFVS